jgi:hypothetical protein
VARFSAFNNASAVIAWLFVKRRAERSTAQA